MPTKLDSFTPRPAASVLVVGDVILDRYVHGTATRISPEAPVPVVRVNRTEERPGGAANVAVNIRSLGVKAQLAGITGADQAADTLARLLAAADVACRFVRNQSYMTPTKLRVISQHQQLLRLDYEREGAPDTTGLLEHYMDLLPGADCVVMSDYAKGSLTRVQELIDAARARGVPVLVDPKARDFNRYRGATALTPNFREFESVVGPCSSETEIATRGAELCRDLELQALIVTRGEHGMTVIDQTRGEARHLPARAHEVFDVTGAGDTVIAVLAAALVSGHTLEQAAEFANVAAGLVVARLGTAAVTPDEINETSTPGVAARAGRVLERNEVLSAVVAAKQRGETVVMTNGCFDLLHAGHVGYLAQARALGDRLLVAVNDDDSVSRLKGQGRPIHGIADRMQLLAALGSVDWVTRFAEDTPEALIELIRPDVLVKGGDYRPDQIAGAATVRSHGGKVIVLPFIEGHSTSAVLQAIRSS